jgi:hypothetical protein
MNFKNIGIFLIGFGVGALVASKMVQNRYEDIIQEEIESIREVESRRVRLNKKTDDIYERVNQQVIESEKSYHKIVENYKDGDYDVNSDWNRSHPYEITDEQFSESMDNFDKITLFYYADEVLADEGEEMIDDVDRAVGIKLLMDWAGDPDESQVLYVRNEKMMIDYEILRMEQPYSEMVNPSKEEG